MDPTLPKSLDRFPHSGGGGHLIQPLGGADHRSYYTSVKMRSILEVCNVLGTSEIFFTRPVTSDITAVFLPVCDPRPPHPRLHGAVRPGSQTKGVCFTATTGPHLLISPFKCH